ncbi:hypothetical protein FF38_12648 [Lucilia cuprina]|uniref:Uncharacterized protein n=1 Tax=Lucilia cuprina TaxID=7375 RepID=A0A0L0C6U4_LUCCU|nr:hypothetical protein FF38_12648 [Lucilia cuprina]
MDTVYGTKKYFQSLSGASDIYRSPACRAVIDNVLVVVAAAAAAVITDDAGDKLTFLWEGEVKSGVN